MKVLKQLRLIKECTQQEIAEKLNIDRSTYSAWENGKVDLTLSQLKRIANEYGIEISALTKMLDEGLVISADTLTNIINQRQL